MGNDVQSDGYTGQANETTSGDQFNAAVFLINQVLNGKWTITLCQVQNVTGGGPGALATVDVQPMVNQMDGQNQATPHGVIYGLPVFRFQGGNNAFIADPKAKDIGLMACASRDISAVKNTQAIANPGSSRSFDPSDGMYIGGFLNAAPTNYIEINDGGINIVAGSAKIIIAVNGQITINGIVWDIHHHNGVTIGGGISGPPS